MHNNNVTNYIHCVKKQNKNLLYKTTAKKFTKLYLLAYSIYNNIWFAFTHSLLIFCVAHREGADRISSCRKLCSANSSEGRYLVPCTGMFPDVSTFLMRNQWLSFCVSSCTLFIAAVSSVPWVWIEDKTNDINNRNSAKESCNNNKVFRSLCLK